MAQRTKSTRVEFREETICNYTDTKFLQSNAICDRRQFSSVVEEFDPINPILAQDQFDYIINRNEAIPQPLIIPASTPAARDTKNIITTIQPTQIIHQDPSIMLRAGRQNVPNMQDAVQHVINRQQYASRLIELNEEGVGLDDLQDKSQLSQRQIDEMYYDPFAEIESFNNFYDRFIAGNEMAIPEVPESIKNAPNAEINSKKYIMEEVIRRMVANGDPITITGGKEITPQRAFEKITEAFEKSNRAFDFINAKDAGVLTPEQKQTLATAKEINDSVMKARAKSKSSTRTLLDEAVPTATTEGTELTNLRLTTEAIQKGYGTQTQRGSAGQGSSTDPVTQPVDSLNINMLSHGLPSEVLSLSFDMPRELSNLKIPQMPDPSKVADLASYRIEKAIYETKLADLYKAIDGTHKIDGYTKQILKKQISIHEQEVELRVRIANNPVTIDDRTNVFGSEFNEPNLVNLEANKFQVELNKLYIQQEIYNELRSIPTADRGVTLAEMQSNSSNFVEYFQNTTGKQIAHSEFIEAIGKVTETITVIELNNPQVTQIQPQQLSTLSNAIKSIKYSQTFQQINTAALGKALFHTAVGFGVSMAAAHFAGEAKVFQNIEDIYQRGAAVGSLVGGIGTVPQIAARFFAIAMRGAAIQAGETALAATSRALVTASITSIGEIITGGILGAALVPLDMVFQDFLQKNGFNKAGAGALSGATMAGISSIASLGIAATVESVQAGALTLGAALGPESLGLSIVVALGTMAFAAIVGAAMGGFTEDRARRDKDTFNTNRREIVKLLPSTNYNVLAAFNLFEMNKYGEPCSPQQSKDDFGDYNTEMEPFIHMLQEKFEGAVFDHPPVQFHELSEKEKTIQTYMARDMLPTMKDLAEHDGNYALAAAIAREPGYNPLTPAEVEWMEKATDRTWMRDSYLAGQIQYEDLKYGQVRSGPAQAELTRLWNDTHTLEYPTELIRLALKDASFANRFAQQRMFDSQRIIMENFQNNGKLLNENEANVITMACSNDPYLENPPPLDSDLNFRQMFNRYTRQMATTADEMNLTVSQLVNLQKLPEEQRARAYLHHQYDTLRANNLTRDEIENLERYDEQNRAVFARGFYSRDDEILSLMPPEEYDTWNPLASQLYQAQEAGMTLRQYVDYMHLLSMGDRGDFNNLPEYSPEQIREQKIQDRRAFQEELDITGNNGLLIFDEATQTFIINPANLVSLESFQRTARRLGEMSEINLYYSPKGFQQTDENFHDLTSGMNEQNQQSYDGYNLRLGEDIEEFRIQYDRQAFEYNNWQHLNGLSEFMYFDAEAEFHSRKLTYTPMSTDIEDYKTDYREPPPKPNFHESIAGKPPRLTVDDNIYGLLSEENQHNADDLVYDAMIGRTGELSHNERQYIYRQIFNQQYYDSQQERDYWDQRSIREERLKFANQGLNAETATDAERADNLHMNLNQYFEWIGTLPTTNDIFFQNEPTTPEEEEEEEEKPPDIDRATVNTKGDRAIADAKARGVYIEPTKGATLTQQQIERQERQAPKFEAQAALNAGG